MGAPNVTGRRLIGRDNELRAFDALLDALAAGESAVVVISGEPGIGKTALMGDVVKRGRERGYEAFMGRATELERHLPFAVFADALEGAVTELSREQRALLSDEELTLAASALPGLLETNPAATTGPVPDDDALMLRALHALLKALGCGQPMVLALDDLQWADPASIDLLCRLLHRELADRSLLVLASRPGQSEPRVRAAFAEAELHGNARRIELAPLSAAETNELLGDGLDTPTARRIYRESGGNPFYLEQLAAAARRGEALSTEPSVPFEPSLPTTVSAAIKRELDGLSSAARLLLQGAAVAGDPFDVELAARTAAVAQPEALDATDELVERDLIRPDDMPARFRFRHPIVRRAVYETAGAGWRLQAHRRAWSALQERGVPPTVLAPHIERCAHVGDELGAGLLARAGEALMSRAPASAARWFDAALRLTPASDGNSEYTLELMTQRAMALGSAGKLEESREELIRFLRAAPRDSSPLRLRAISLCARLDQALGTPAAGRRLLLDELARLLDQAGREAAFLKNELAISYYFDGNWPALKQWAAAALAADCGGMTRVSSLALLGQAEFASANLEPARQVISEAGEQFDRLDSDELDPSVAVWLSDVEVGCERFADALRHTQRSIAIFGNDRRTWAVPLLDAQVASLSFLGRVPDLAASAESAIEAALLTSSDPFLSMAMALRSWASLLSGDVAAAVRFGERSVELSCATLLWNDFYSRSQLAWALLEAGEPARCLEQLTRPDDKPSLAPVPFVRGSHCEHLVRAEIALGNLAAADELARDACQATESLSTGVWLCFARRALALTLLARGKTDAALAEARAACEHAETAGTPIEIARSQVVAARALAENDDRPGAIASLSSAYETLSDCGEVLNRDRVARELRRLGRAVPNASNGRNGTHGALGLSGRECEVMELVAAGRRNREIAGELFLSVRTVERHVARIFEKLDVHSRAAASSIFERTRTGAGASERSTLARETGHGEALASSGRSG